MILTSRLDPTGETARNNRRVQLDLLGDLRTEFARAVAGGGERAVKRHLDRGRLLVRERIDLLLDPDSPFLELSTLAAWGSEFAVGASLVTGVGVVADRLCLVIGHDPTVRGGAINPWSLRKSLRALEIARVNRLPVVNLVESGGADLPSQAELFVPGGRVFHELTALSAAGVPTVALVFGAATAGGAYVPAMCDHTVMVDGQAQVSLGGPPLVRMATGEDTDAEALGGAAMHAGVSGLADHLARSEHDAVRIGRDVLARVARTRPAPPPPSRVRPPREDPDDLLAVVPTDPKVAFDPREVLARVVDDSAFDEVKAGYGTAVVTGWATIHGHPVGVLANHRGVLGHAESEKAAEFVQQANLDDTPLVFLQNTTGFMVGAEYEQRGIVKDGAKLINAVANSDVPHLTINLAGSYGAGNYGMSGRAFDPRFAFAWPGARLAVMGAEQLAGVLSIVARESAAAQGRDHDDDADARRRAAVTAQIEAESDARAVSGRLLDDGVIDPRDTRDVLGMALAVVTATEVRGRRGFGKFRM